LTARAGDQSVQLAWGASRDKVGVQAYRVYRGGVQVAQVGGSTLSYTNTGLVNGTSYSYTVRAIDRAGNLSAPSNTASATPVAVAPVDSTAPSAPAGLAATAGDTRVSLSWGAASDNVGVTAYRVFRGATQVAQVGGSTLTYTDTGLVNGTSYSYTVRALDAAGNVSVASNTASATPAGSSTPPPPPSSPQPPSLPGSWNLKLNEEFTSVDPGRWIQKFWWNGDTYWPTQELQVYRSSNTTASGELSLTAKSGSGLTNFQGSTTDSDGEPFAYTSGLVSSGGLRGATAPGYQYTYGYAEARIWVPAGQGIFPAFWMLDSDYSDRSEIDIMETIGSDPATLQMHYHGPSGTYGAAYTNPQALSAGWHTYALDWQPGQLRWYLDGVQRASLSRSDVPSNPHYVLFNLAVGGRNSWPRAPDSSTPFPSTMKVDWFRVWQH
jgi:beta-glucanase (GH16 family)